MALATTQITGTAGASARSLQMSGWGRLLPHLLVITGATTVIVGSYTTWATFYAGLIARNGVAGHGKYFIALAAGAVLASLLTNMRGVWSGLRWTSLVAGVLVAAGPQLDRAVGHDGLHAEAVPLGLEQPVVVVERIARQRRSHWLDVRGLALRAFPVCH